MLDFPVFLFPSNEILKAVILERGLNDHLRKTIFPANSKYYVSNNGIAACIDRDLKIIIYGQLDNYGNFEFIKVIPFPLIINPKSIIIYENTIIIGGHNEFSPSGTIKTYELLVTFSIISERFKVINIPNLELGNSIDFFFLDKNKVVALNSIYSKGYFIEYDFRDPNIPRFLKSYCFPEENAKMKILKVTTNEKFIGILASKHNVTNRYIYIFKKGSYDKYLKLTLSLDTNFFESLDYSMIDEEECDIWKDILLLPSYNFLIIGGSKGFGIYVIDPEKMNSKVNHSFSVYYYNKLNKKIIKIEKIPNDNQKFIAKGEGLYTDFLNCGKMSFKFIHLENLINDYNKNTNEEKIVFKRKSSKIYQEDRSIIDTRREYFDAITDGQKGDFDDYIERGGNIDDIDL